LAGILGSIEQTFGRAPLYPSAQIRAAHLLYFVILVLTLLGDQAP